MSDAVSKIKRQPVKGVKNLFQRGGSFYLLVSINGKQHYEKLAAGNRTDAEHERNIRVGELRSRGRIELQVGEDLSFSELAARFIEHERGPSGKLTKRTCDLREQLLSKHVVPALGEMQARSITTPHIQSLADRLTKGTDGTPLSGSSVRGIVTSVSCVLSFGCRYGHVTSNACREVSLPSASRTSEPRYLDHRDVLRLLGALTPSFKPVAACAYYAALRASEVLSLRWADVSLETATIHVRQGKTRASINSVPVPLPLLGILRAHRDAQASKGLQWITEGALVFPTSTGQPQSRRNALRAVNNASKVVGLWSEEDGREPVGLHDLRHSAASFYFSQGRKTREVSRLLRHANPGVTMAVYSGLSPQEDELIIEAGRNAWAV